MTQHSGVATARRNYRLGLVNGIMFTFGESISNPSLVLALLIRQLGASLTVIGALPAIQTAGYLLPQILVSGALQGRPYKLPTYRLVGGIRLVAQLALVAAIVSAGMIAPGLALTLIVGLFALFNLCGGITTLSFQDVVAKTVPPSRRGSYFGTRQLFGGLLAFALGGPLVRWALSAGSPLAFPLNFGLLSATSLLCFTIAIAAFALVREPPQERLTPPLRLSEGLRRAPELLRGNHNYRWFIITRLLIRLGQIAEPFYIIYATERLGLPASVSGVLVATAALSGALSNILWSRIADKQSSRRLIPIVGSLFLAAPLLLIAGPDLAIGLGLGQTALTVAVGLVALLSGSANDGIGIVAMTYILDVVPENERPTYLGLANAILGLGALVPIVGGRLVEGLGYQPTFLLAAVCALAGLLASRKLREPQSSHMTHASQQH